MNEDLENTRASIAKRALEAFVKVVEEEGRSFGERLQAGTLIHEMLHDINLGNLAAKGIDTESSKVDKLIRSANRLGNERSEP
jgi:hypothetical protein